MIAKAWNWQYYWQYYSINFYFELVSFLNYVWSTRKWTGSLLAQKVPFSITCYSYVRWMKTNYILSYLKVMGRTITYLMRTHENIHKNIKSSRVNSLYYSRTITIMQWAKMNSCKRPYCVKSQNRRIGLLFRWWPNIIYWACTYHPPVELCAHDFQFS